MKAAARKARVAVFSGDGIGPEVIDQTRLCLDAVAQRFDFAIEWVEAFAGGTAIDRYGVALPEESLALARDSDAVLLGAVGGPRWDDPGAAVRPEQALLRLRKELDLFANLRPVQVCAPLRHASPLKGELLEGVDILFVRELTGGIYYGEPSGRYRGAQGREAVDTLRYREGEVERVARAAFGFARDRRRLLTSVDKANILASSRLWREVVHEVACDYPDVTCENILVDAMTMHLLQRPREFDVILAENLFGDILTDEASVLTASLGMLPSASLGMERNAVGGVRGLYEPVHGSAPDIAGRDMANPVAAILSGALLLRHSLVHEAASAALEGACWRVLEAGWRTADLRSEAGRLVGCAEMGRLVRHELERGPS